MSYSNKVLDHYENPRNVGSFEKGDGTVGTGMVGAPACGECCCCWPAVGDAAGSLADLGAPAPFAVAGAGDPQSSLSSMSDGGGAAVASTCDAPPPPAADPPETVRGWRPCGAGLSSRVRRDVVVISL